MLDRSRFLVLNAPCDGPNLHLFFFEGVHKHPHLQTLKAFTVNISPPHFNHRQNNCSDSSEVICSLCKAKIQSCVFFFIRYLLRVFSFIVVRSITKYAILTMKFRGTLTTLTILYNRHQYLLPKLFSLL